MSLSTSQRRARNRAALILGVGVVTAALGILAYEFNVLRSYELKTVDARFALRGSTGTPDDVVNVLIDDKTFSDFKRPDGLQWQWPYPRRFHGQVIRNIAKGKPAAIAFDVQFTEPTNDRDDAALILAVRAARNVVLAATEVDKQGRTNVFGGAAEENGAFVGNANVVPDSDGVIRHMAYELNKLKSFGVVTAEVALGRPLPQPSADSQWIDYAGPPGTVKAYSYVDVVQGKVPPSAFRGKIVVIGPSAPSLQDVHATSASGSESMSGAEIQANAVETALGGFPLQSAPDWLNLCLIVLFSLIAPFVTLRLSGWWPGLVAVVAGVLLALGEYLAFNGGWIPVFTYPLGALAISTAAALIIQYILEAFDRALTRDAFSRFVPETVVAQVLAKTDQHLRLGGEQVIGTAMFTDLRGFTTFSESLPAEQVIDLLNRYLSSISDAILAHGGTIVSYLGDGLMAVFGAPLPQADHADRALAAGLDMLENRLPEFNKWMQEQGFERGFKMGVGLNTGPFMSGNVGSERRLEYTAIGDTINTASRLEGMTKGTPYALFFADSTREALTRERDDLSFIDEMAVRGRQGTIKLWSISNPAVLKEDWESEGGAKKPEPAPEVAPVAAPT